MFWGTVFVVIGLSIILNSVFHINLPIFKTLIAIFFIYLGAQMLFGSFGIDIKGRVTDNAAVFGSGQFQWPESTESFERDGNSVKYSVVFGEGRLDLSKVDFAKENPEVRVDTVFGETTLYIPEGMAYIIEVNTVFADADLPNDTKAVVGRNTYRSPEAINGKPALRIKANIVFGSLKVRSSQEYSAKTRPQPAGV